MEKYASYNEKELGEVIEKVYSNLYEMTHDLAMISQQLDGKRSNLEGNYIQRKVMSHINKAVANLRGLGINSSEIKDLDINKAIRNLEKIMAEEIY